MATWTGRPNASGSETSIPDQYPDSSDHYDKVDDTGSGDGAGTFVLVPTSDQGYWRRDLYQISNPSLAGAINSVTVYSRCMKFTTGEFLHTYAKTSLKSGATVADGSQEGLDESWTLYSTAYSNNPDDSQAWSWDDIDALEIGVSLYTAYQSPVQYSVAECTQVYVEVDYTPASDALCKLFLGHNF